MSVLGRDDSDPLTVCTTTTGRYGNLYHYDLDWTPVPTKAGTKYPAIKWAEFQHRKPTDAELISWNATYWDTDDSGIGVVTGSGSGLTVIDVDTLAAKEWLLDRFDLPETATATTRRGEHFYFDSTGQQLSSVAALQGVGGLDVRGDGGFVVAPPTAFLDQCGRYVWKRDPRHGVAPLPHALSDLIRSDRSAGPSRCTSLEDYLRPIHEGERNDALMRIGGHLLADGFEENQMVQLLHAWNEKFAAPPLAEAEVNGVLDSLLRRHRAGGTRRAAFDSSQRQLLRRMLENGASYRELATFTGTSTSTVHRAVQTAEFATLPTSTGRERSNLRKPPRDKAQRQSRRSTYDRGAPS